MIYHCSFGTKSFIFNCFVNKESTWAGQFSQVILKLAVSFMSDFDSDAAVHQKQQPEQKGRMQLIM